MYKIFDKIELIDLKKSESCQFNRFTRAFLEQSSFFVNDFLGWITPIFDSPLFQSNVIKAHISRYESEKFRFTDKLNGCQENLNSVSIYKAIINTKEQKLKHTSFHSILNNIQQEFKEYTGVLETLNTEYKYIHQKDGTSYITKYYIYYFIGDLLYEDYKRVKHQKTILSTEISSSIINEYTKIDIDLVETDNQFSKYGLISLNQNFEIHNDKDCQAIFDKRLKKYLWIVTPRTLLTIIEDLLNKELIKNIAFKVDFISTLIPSFEDLEFGSPMNLCVSELPKISKFYSSSNYGNKLWVKHDIDKHSLTFEEIVDDFDVLNEDILTQVIHLNYYQAKEDYFIEHLDHEYIIYSMEQYEEKLLNPDIKGYKKIKTFKIDKASIPFSFTHENEYFLFRVLDSFFKNKDLVSEYFSECN